MLVLQSSVHIYLPPSQTWEYHICQESQNVESHERPEVWGFILANSNLLISAAPFLEIFLLDILGKTAVFHFSN